MRKRRPLRRLPSERSDEGNKSESAEQAKVRRAIDYALEEVSRYDADLAKALGSEIRGRKLLRYKPT